MLRNHVSLTKWTPVASEGFGKCVLYGMDGWEWQLKHQRIRTGIDSIPFPTYERCGGGYFLPPFPSFPAEIYICPPLSSPFPATFSTASKSVQVWPLKMHGMMRKGRARGNELHTWFVQPSVQRTVSLRALIFFNPCFKIGLKSIRKFKGGCLILWNEMDSEINFDIKKESLGIKTFLLPLYNVNRRGFACLGNASKYFGSLLSARELRHRLHWRWERTWRETGGRLMACEHMTIDRAITAHSLRPKTFSLYLSCFLRPLLPPLPCCLPLFYRRVKRFRKSSCSSGFPFPYPSAVLIRIL